MKQSKISRRSFLLGLGAVSTAALLTACGEAASSTPASSAASSEAPASSASEVPAAPILTEDEFPVTDGSTACIPLIAQIMADTTGMELEAAQSAVTTNTTAWAWRNLGLYGDTENGTRLIIAYEAPESVKEELKADGAPLDQKAIGRDALVFIVNEDNPVQSLTRQQLRDIYSGQITNWKDVGGEDADIVAFQRREDSGSQTLFQKLLIQGGELMDAPTELAPALMGELVDDIAEYNNAANAIGFSVYYYISEMYSKPGLRLLAVDGVTPSFPFFATMKKSLAVSARSAARREDAKENEPCSNPTTTLWKATAAPRCATTSSRHPPCWRSLSPGWSSSACCSASCRC